MSTYLVDAFGIPSLIAYNMTLSVLATCCVAMAERRAAAQGAVGIQ